LSRAEDQVSRFVEVTAPYHERLFRIAMTLCHDRDQAADLTQETLVRAFSAFDRFRVGEPVLPWLARILRNLHLDLVKSGRARYEVPARQLGERQERQEDPFANVAAKTPDPLTELERSQLAGWLAEELEALEPAHQLIVVLCDVEELSYQEAAEVAGIPVGTVRSRLSRAREQLRERLRRRMAGAMTSRRYGTLPTK
jgi:RNA polymerase sigma-70 factor (ECF subfamily)